MSCTIARFEVLVGNICSTSTFGVDEVLSLPCVGDVEIRIRSKRKYENICTLHQYSVLSTTISNTLASVFVGKKSKRDREMQVSIRYPKYQPCTTLYI